MQLYVFSWIWNGVVSNLQIWMHLWGFTKMGLLMQRKNGLSHFVNSKSYFCILEFISCKFVWWKFQCFKVGTWKCATSKKSFLVCVFWVIIPMKQRLFIKDHWYHLATKALYFIHIGMFLFIQSLQQMKVFWFPLGSILIFQGSVNKAREWKIG